MKNVALSALLVLTLCESRAVTNKVLIIGIDGLMPSALAIAKTPNLDQLKSNGFYSVRAVTHPITHSAACWSSMFTGVWGDKHLVNDPGNSFTGNDFARYPSFFKRLEDFRSAWQTVCLARWSPLLTVVPDADVKLSFGSDDAITAETCKRLTNGNPDVMYTILLDVDSAGHSYGWGETVPNYVKAIENADTRVGIMLSALRNRATLQDENWLLIALSDHGEHDHPDPERSRITFHIVSGASAARGEMWPSPAIVDVCATVLTHMGVPIESAWNLDARVEGLPLPPVRYGTNLIFNGDAEANSGTDRYATNRGIAWWFDISNTTIGAYGANAAFPTGQSPGPLERGQNFFLGGGSPSSVSQRLDLSEIAADIDGAKVSYNLSGWFGGAGANDASASLTLNLLDSQGNILRSDTIGGVTPAERAFETGLVKRSHEDTVPKGTRFAELILATAAGDGVSAKDASADNLSFVLSNVSESPPVLVATLPALPGQFTVTAPDFTAQVGRLYVLERTVDLKEWTVAAELSGEGQSLVFTDPQAPVGGAFYRVSIR